MSAAVIADDATKPFSGALYLGKDRREFNGPAEPLEMDLTRFYLNLSYNVYYSGEVLRRKGGRSVNWRPVSTPGLTLFVEAGAAKAERDNSDDGEYGPDLGVGLEISTARIAVFDSAVIGKEADLMASIALKYTDTESNFSNRRDFSWSELTLTPKVTYIATPRSDLDMKQSYRPSQVRLHLGAVAILDSDGDFDGSDLETARDFGLLFGVDFELAEVWSVLASGVFYGDSDRALRLGFALDF
ncbi:MAG: hypothetical protein AAF492_11505 [Verrucomicrobiota bacterium]